MYQVFSLASPVLAGLWTFWLPAPHGFRLYPFLVIYGAGAVAQASVFLGKRHFEQRELRECMLGVGLMATLITSCFMTTDVRQKVLHVVAIVVVETVWIYRLRSSGVTLRL